MTPDRLRPGTDDSSFERIVSAVMLVVFWTAFTCLAAGLGFWLGFPYSDMGSLFLAAGLLGLLVLPLLRLCAAVAAALRARDWITLGATLAVLGILATLTIRDAVLTPPP